MMPARSSRSSFALSVWFTLVALFAIQCAMNGEGSPASPVFSGMKTDGGNGNGNGGGSNSDASSDGSMDSSAEASSDASSADGGACSTALANSRAQWLIAQPITPPHMFAGLDFAGATWGGVSIDTAESAPASGADAGGGGLCQGVELGPQGVCPSGFGECSETAWGPNQEVLLWWDVATRQADQIELLPGYTGTITTASYPDHTGVSHTYSIGVGSVIKRDGEPFEIQWGNFSTRLQQFTDIFNALMATFGASDGFEFSTASCTQDSQCAASGQINTCQCAHAPSSSQCVTGTMGQCGRKSCQSDGSCLVIDDGSSTLFGVRPLRLFVKGEASVPQPLASTPQAIYTFSRWTPSSALPFHVALDANGPIAQGSPYGIPTNSSATCTLGIGLTFSDYKNNCVEVSGNSTIDQVNLQKAINDLTHDREHYSAPITGTSLGFTSAAAEANQLSVVTNGYAPQPTDFAQAWTMDVSQHGRIANDWTFGQPSFAAFTLQGSALIMIEWAHLMLADIARITGTTARKLGDPACTGYSQTGAPNYASTPGCTGIEGLIIPSSGGLYDFTLDPGISQSQPSLDPGTNFDIYQIYTSLLEPGLATGAFCVDPGVESDCTADLNASLFLNALHHVTRVLGAGNIASLPAELQDSGYYYRWFAIAYVKYLKAYGNYLAQYGAAANNFPNGIVGGGLAPWDVVNQPIDLEELTFTQTVYPTANGAQTIDLFRYVDRDNIGQGAGGSYNYIPWVFEYGTDLVGGTTHSITWKRAMDRQEVALYSAMLTNKSHTPGQEANVNLTNLFGSVLLGGDSSAAITGTWPSYACAIGQAGDPAVACNGTNAPLDPSLPSGAQRCDSDSDCSPGQLCGSAISYVSGYVHACGRPCDFATYPNTGCASATQACTVNNTTSEEVCMDIMTNKNGRTAASPLPLLSAYPAAWARSPLGRGHTPITLPVASEMPSQGTAQITIPNFLAGPYTVSPIANSGTCPNGYAASTDGLWCNAALYTGAGPGTTAPSFSPLVGFTAMQPTVGFSVPGAAPEFISTGKLDFSGTFASYVVDYRPYRDPFMPSCGTGNTCSTGYVCTSQQCNATDNSLAAVAIEGNAFAGQVFVCTDPLTNDVLHVGAYDSASSILAWLTAHPGGNPGYGIVPSAQTACEITVSRASSGAVTSIISRVYGVTLTFDYKGSRVVGATLFDTNLL